MHLNRGAGRIWTGSAPPDHGQPIDLGWRRRRCVRDFVGRSAFQTGVVERGDREKVGRSLIEIVKSRSRYVADAARLVGSAALLTPIYLISCEIRFEVRVPSQPDAVSSSAQVKRDEEHHRKGGDEMKPTRGIEQVAPASRRHAFKLS